MERHRHALKRHHGAYDTATWTLQSRNPQELKRRCPDIMELHKVAEGERPSRLEACLAEGGATGGQGLCPLPPWAATPLDRHGRRSLAAERVPWTLLFRAPSVEVEVGATWRQKGPLPLRAATPLESCAETGMSVTATRPSRRRHGDILWKFLDSEAADHSARMTD